MGMRGLRRLAMRLVNDDRGGEVLEYVLIAGLIVAATVAVVATIGSKVLARWTTVSDSL
jgi:pilus assembly protein Flp/PilA